MTNNTKALDAMYAIIHRMNDETVTMTTDELREIVGDDYTIHTDRVDKQWRKPSFKHKFGKVIETGGHFWVAASLGDTWVLDDTYGPVIVAVYDELKADMAEKRENRERGNGKKRMKWTVETVLEEASKYESRKQFRTQCGSAYQKAIKLGIKDQLVFAE